MATPLEPLSPRSSPPPTTRMGDSEDDDDDDNTDVDIHDTVPVPASQNDDTSQRPLPPPPPPSPMPLPLPVAARKQRYRFEVQNLSFIPRFLERRRRDKSNIETLMPPSTPDLLHKLSLDSLSDIALERTVALRAAIRECEDLAGDGIDVLRRRSTPATRKDLRRLLCTYDDYALRKRPTRPRADKEFSRLHQMALFIARMKIINVLENCELLDAVDTHVEQRSGDRVNLYVENHYGVAAAALSDAELAMWMRENNACHPGVLVVERATQRPGHRLQSCSLECFWQTILSLMAAWPALPMSPHLLRMFAELRRRCAFFLSYREFSSADAKQRFDADQRKILGLEVSLFTLVDFDDADTHNATAATSNAAGGLLDNFNLATIGEDGYVAVNAEFVDQCEAILHHIHVAMRQAAGFVAAELLAELSDEHLKRFEELIEEELASTFRGQITEEFRGVVMTEYLQPSEMAEFGLMHEREVQTALNCISRQRQADFRRLSESLLLQPLDAAWRGRRGQLTDPAYACLAALATNYHLQQFFRGAEFHHYLVRADTLEAFPHIDERFGRHRNLYAELHTARITTGTLKYRAKLLQESGLAAPRAEAEYEHPLVLKTLNGFDVVHNGCTHRAASFAHAFLHWLELMCTDRFVRGVLAQGGASLQPLYRRLFPERAAAIDAFEAETEARLVRYNPVTRLIGDAELDGARDARTRQRHAKMSQF